MHPLKAGYMQGWLHVMPIVQQADETTLHSEVGTTAERGTCAAVPDAHAAAVAARAHALVVRPNKCHVLHHTERLAVPAARTTVKPSMTPDPVSTLSSAGPLPINVK